MPTNLILNGDFETTLLAPWVTDPSSRTIVTTARAHTGTHCVRFCHRGEEHAIEYHFKEETWSVDDLRFWLLAEPLGHIEIQVFYTSGGPPFLLMPRDTFEFDGFEAEGWTQITVPIRRSHETSYPMKIAIIPRSSTMLYVDDFTLKGCTAAEFGLHRFARFGGLPFRPSFPEVPEKPLDAPLAMIEMLEDRLIGIEARLNKIVSGITRMRYPEIEKELFEHRLEDKAA